MVRNTATRGFPTARALGSLRRMKFFALTFALPLFLLGSSAQAQYKCISATGGVTYQQSACPIAQQQQSLHARPALPPVTSPSPIPSAPQGKPSTDPAPSAAPRNRAKDEAASVASIEANFERLKVVRADLDATRKLPAK